jgi:VanZ family protein
MKDARGRMKSEREPSRGVIGFVRYRLPAVLWTAVILMLSTAAGSSQRTEMGLAELLFWLVGHKPSYMTLELTNVALRKLSHLGAYALEMAVMLRAVRYGRPQLERAWIARAFALTLAIAALDEFNQSRNPGRTGSLADVILDMIGATMVILLVWRRTRA